MSTHRNVPPASKVEGSVTLPPDKSISHRAAMFAALHDGTSEITNYSEADDPRSTLKCLRALGVSIEEDNGRIIIEGVGREGLKDPESELDCGNSGTTMRLLSGIVGGAGVSCTLTGDESLSARTMKRIIDPLSRMGIRIEARDNNYAPLKISRSKPLRPMQFMLPIPSAQLKSCVLLASLFSEEPSRVIETVTSRDHTERLLNLPVDHRGGNKIISSSREIEIPEQTYRIPGDFSAAAFWLVAGAVHPQAEIKLESTGVNPTRTGALHILRKMEARIEIDNERNEGFEPVADLRVRSSRLQPVHITSDLVPNCIDELPILAVAMLFADGKSRISGAGELRHKETDRLKAVAELLEKAGADFIELKDGFEINGSPDFVPKAAEFESYHDHRIAMAAGVLSMMARESSRVRHAGCTAVSYPGFWDDMDALTN